MLLKLYDTTEATNVINKSLSVIKQITIRLRGRPDMSAPVIMLKGIEFDHGYNYASLDDRYYFVDSVESVGGDVFRLSLSLDPLETFKADILASKARYRRNLKNGDFVSSGIDLATTKTIVSHSSDVTLVKEPTMILTTIGG